MNNRNQKCACNSGLKYKNCCLSKDSRTLIIDLTIRKMGFMIQNFIKRMITIQKAEAHGIISTSVSPSVAVHLPLFLKQLEQFAKDSLTTQEYQTANLKFDAIEESIKKLIIKNCNS